MKKLFTQLAAVLVILICLIASCKKDAVSGTDAGNDIAETASPVQKGITVDVNPNIGGYQEALPARYDSTSKKYPLLVCLHGVGELGNGAADLGKAANNGVPALIKKKQFPAHFTVNNTNYSFIVLSPQFKAWPAASDINTLITYAISKYRVDTARIYVTGLSMGGGATWEYAAVYASRVAAIVPVCGASSPSNTKAQKIAQAHLPVWAFHNKDDSTVTYLNSTGYVDKMNSYAANPAPRLSLWPTGGHNAWTKATDPTYKENGMNMYEWMLQYTR